MLTYPLMSVKKHLWPSYFHSVFPPWGGETYLIGQPGKLLAGQVPKDALFPHHGVSDLLMSRGPVVTLLVSLRCRVFITSEKGDIVVSLLGLFLRTCRAEVRPTPLLQPSLMDKWKEDSIWNPRPWFQTLASPWALSYLEKIKTQ